MSYFVFCGILEMTKPPETLGTQYANFTRSGSALTSDAVVKCWPLIESVLGPLEIPFVTPLAQPLTLPLILPPLTLPIVLPVVSMTVLSPLVRIVMVVVAILNPNLG